MTKTFALITAIGISLSGSALAASYKLNDKGKCHDDKGKFAKRSCAWATRTSWMRKANAVTRAASLLLQSSVTPRPDAGPGTRLAAEGWAYCRLGQRLGEKWIHTMR